MGIHSPCKTCEERFTACWNECERYKEYRREWDEMKHKRKMENVYDKYRVGLHLRCKNISNDSRTK